MFIFDASSIISYEDFDIFIRDEKGFFIKERNKIFEKYSFFEKKDWDGNIEKYQNFRNDYRGLVQKVIKDTISFYRPYLPRELFISEFGSFVKRTERIFSDVDFTICYDEKKTNTYECAEELLDYNIAKIFDYSIDHVHGNFQHYPKHPEFDKLTESDNQYRIQFENHSIDYSCGPETLSENLTNIKNVRDYQTLLTSFEIKYQRKADIDSLYSIEILENNTNHDFLSDLSILEEKNDICEGYQFKFDYSTLEENFTVSEVKKILKHGGIVEFYIFLSMLRKKLGINNKYSMDVESIWNNIQFINFYGNDYVKKLHEKYIAFLFFWNRIEYSLLSRGIPLSTRCYKQFSTSELNEILEDDWGKGTSIQRILLSKNQLVEMIKNGVNKVLDVK